MQKPHTICAGSRKAPEYGEFSVSSGLVTFFSGGAVSAALTNASPTSIEANQIQQWHTV